MRRQRRRPADGRDRDHAPRALSRRRRRRAVRRRRHHDARRVDPADHQRVRRVGQPEEEGVLRLHAVVLALRPGEGAGLPATCSSRPACGTRRCSTTSPRSGWRSSRAQDRPNQLLLQDQHGGRARRQVGPLPAPPRDGAPLRLLPRPRRDPRLRQPGRIAAMAPWEPSTCTSPAWTASSLPSSGWSPTSPRRSTFACRAVSGLVGPPAGRPRPQGSGARPASLSTGASPKPLPPVNLLGKVLMSLRLDAARASPSRRSRSCREESPDAALLAEIRRLRGRLRRPRARREPRFRRPTPVFPHPHSAASRPLQGVRFLGTAHAPPLEDRARYPAASRQRRPRA